MKRKSFFCFLLVLLTVLGLFAQQAEEKPVKKTKKKAQLLKINFNIQRATGKSMIRGASSGSRRSADWGIVDLTYNCFDEWVDDLTFTYQVLFFNKDLKKKDIMEKFMLLTDQVTYQNVSMGKNKKARIYIHPNTMSRYGEVKEIRVTAAAKGVDENINVSFSKSNERKYLGKWWEKGFPSKKGEMLVRFYTPFIFESGNASEMIKIK